MTVIQCCANCRFWLRSDDVKKTGAESILPGAGLCRRFPPTVTIKGKALKAIVNDSYGPRTEVAQATRFPVMGPDEWCGEYQQRPAVAKRSTAKPKKKKR